MKNPREYAQEDRLVAELDQLGVGYLSRQVTSKPAERISPDILISGLLQQPSSRVRTAVIALFLAHPEYAEYVQAALQSLPAKNAQTLKIYYSAACLLQKQYASSLKPFLGVNWKTLPDLFSEELGLTSLSTHAGLGRLARIQTELTQTELDWAGTYDNAARHLLRRWQMERKWNLESFDFARI